jgi:hypothetical protein
MRYAGYLIRTRWIDFAGWIVKIKDIMNQSVWLPIAGRFRMSRDRFF